MVHNSTSWLSITYLLWAENWNAALRIILRIIRWFFPSPDCFRLSLCCIQLLNLWGWDITKSGAQTQTSTSWCFASKINTCSSTGCWRDGIFISVCNKAAAELAWFGFLFGWLAFCCLFVCFYFVSGLHTRFKGQATSVVWLLCEELSVWPYTPASQCFTTAPVVPHVLPDEEFFQQENFVFTNAL